MQYRFVSTYRGSTQSLRPALPYGAVLTSSKVLRRERLYRLLIRASQLACLRLESIPEANGPHGPCARIGIKASRQRKGIQFSISMSSLMIFVNL